MLGIEENNNPIDIKYLTKALRDAIHKHPEREEYYKITFKDIYIMEEFQKRMCEEYKELADRLTKLQTALGKDGFREKVGDYQYKLMKEQAQGMEMYLKALTARMKDMDIDVLWYELCSCVTYWSSCSSIYYHYNRRISSVR